MNWFFELVGDVVHLNARLEDGEMLGDAHTEISKDEEFYGISYNTLKQAENGEIEVDSDGNARIVAD